MNSLQVSIEPKAGVTVRDNVGIVSVDVVYLRTVESDSVQETVRITLDEKLRGSFALEDVAPSKPIDFCFLGANGSVRLRKTITPEPRKPLFVILTAPEVSAITAEDPKPTASDPLIDRRAYFVPVGDEHVPFDKSKLQITPIRLKNEGWSQLGLDQLFHADSATTSSIQWTGALPATLLSLAWTPFHLEVGGQFSFSFPKGSGEAWVWWLSGPLPAIGVVLDDLNRARVNRIAVPLPPFPGVGPSAGDDTRVPSDVTEAEVVSNPQIYSEDPGEFCKPFKNPERVLGERSFFVILRAEQPVTSPEASVNQDPFVTLTDVRAIMSPATPGGGSSPRGRGRARQPASAISGVVISAAAAATVVHNQLPKAYLDLLGRFNRGRTVLDATHPIQWEGDVSRYQATTVARGHILEYRMRWRSNGYSLGTVAKTLTLAPRQTKRIQTIEWRRSELSRRQETTRLFDQVSDTVSRDRDYQDSVEANLSEWARGESESSMYSGAAGFGFAGSGFVIGGGGGGSHASSESSQQGGRRASASEEQRLRDSIRRYGDALRKLDSLVVNEVTQQETVTGTTEIVRNANYAHSLTVIYYQILRHLKIETGVAGVRECLFVPFAITPFTVARAYRWREFIQKGLRDPQYGGAIKYLKDVQTNFLNSDVPPGRRSDQPVRFIFGSLFIRMAVERPRDKDDGTFDAITWGVLSPFLGSPALSIFNMLHALSEAQRDAVFQQKHAGVIAANWVDTLQMDAGGTPVVADFTMATRYQFGGVARVDFSIPAPPGNITREVLASIHVKATKNLAPGSIANVQSLTFTYQTDKFQRTVSAAQGAEDLVDVDSGAPDIGATVTTIPDEWERRDLRAEMTNAVLSLIEHLNEHVEYYHKVIWWNMDRDRLFMLIDGFYVPGTNGFSIASVVERDPIAIIGNAIVFRVSSGSFLGLGDIKKPEELLNYYISMQAPSEPMLVSLPTDGLYAQTVMDECMALEEHYGNIDWALNDPDPALGEIAPELLATRRAEPPSAQPTQLPPTLINLQNAPEAPAPSGLAGALSAVTTANAFRDMAGLAGTQANAATAFQTAANLATNFGNQAAALKLAEIAEKAHATQTADQKVATVQRAYDKGLTSLDDAQQHTSKILENLHTPAPTSDQPRAAAATQAIFAASSEETPWTVEHTDALGSTKVSSGGGGVSAKTGGPSMSPFPAPFADNLTIDAKLQKAFDDALAIAKTDPRFAVIPNMPSVDDLPIIIVALNDDKTQRPHVGQHLENMHYSGSMAKFAAMYAAYQLRSAVNEFAVKLGDISENDFFAALEKTFDPQIKGAVPAIRDNIGMIREVIGGAAVFEDLRLPKYRRIFNATKAAGKFIVDFRVNSADPDQNFLGHMREMIVQSDNFEAGITIRTLGYGLINGTLANAGFFKSGKGIWLAGDYNQAPVVTIASENDGQVKQVTNCLQTARLFTLLYDDLLIKNTITGGVPSDGARDEMLELLRKAVGPGTHAPSILGRNLPSPPAPAPFTVLGCKIGVGTLKDVPGQAKSSCNLDPAGHTNRCVVSEVSILQQTAPPKRKFVVCWQNVLDATNRGDADITRIIDLIANTMSRYNP
jgi:hypothetical protein